MTVWRRSGCSERLGIYVGSNTVAEAVQTVARENGFHPVHDYLKSLVWDKVSRIDTWLIDYLGCTDSAFARAVGSPLANLGCCSHLPTRMSG